MDISPADWDRVRTVFFAAQDLEPEERDAFVHDTCGDDAVIEAEVRRLLAMDPEESFLATSADPLALVVEAPPLFQKGDVLAGRFHIIELIGRGGMSEVYEAHDAMLNCVVALKVAKPGQEPLPRLEARWRRELLLSRRITHSGVCRVHDIAIHRSESGESSLLLTMERLFGTPLASRIRASTLTPEEGLSIARQVGDALDAAHAQGVLHRDIKPENILIEPLPNGGVRAVLTDFGLAKPTTGGDNEMVTKTGMFVGTRAYMAPELPHGKPASIQSDLYAFTMVVRDMLDAAAPENTRLLQPIMTRGMDQEPSARYSSAREFMVDVMAALAPAPAPTPAPTPKPSWWSRRRVIGAVATVVTVTAIAFGLYRPGLRDEKPPAPTETSSPVTTETSSQLLVTDIDNRTTDPDLSGLTLVLRAHLIQSAKFGLVDTARVGEVLKTMERDADTRLTPEIAREVAMRDNVPLVLFGDVGRSAAAYTVTVRLERVSVHPARAKETWEQRFTVSSKNDLFKAMHDAAVWIRSTAGEVGKDIEDRDWPDTTTTSWNALRLLHQANGLTAKGDHADAVVVLEQAIRLDPEFAMAHMRLADQLISLKRDKEGYEAWQRAIALLERRQVTGRETLRIRAQYYDDTGDLVEAEKAYRTFTLNYPNDYEAQFLRGHILVETNQVPPALPYLAKAYEIRPKSVVGAVHLASAYLDAGRSVEAARIIDTLPDIGGADWARWLRALALFRERRVDEAFAEFGPLRTSTDKSWQSRAFTIRAAWLSEMGRDDRALEELRAGIAYDGEANFPDREADKWLHVATLQLRAGRREDAAISARQALRVASNVKRIAIAAGIIARSGDVNGARQLAKSLDDFAPVPATETARQYLLGQVYASEGSEDKAVQALDYWLKHSRRSEDRMPVVRALLASGDTSGAERLLREIVERPVAIYARPEPQAPGLWREALVELERLLAARDPAAAARLRGEHRFIWPEGSSQGAQQSGHN